MSKQLYADMVVNAVVAQDPTKPRLARLALQRAVDDGGDSITIMLHGDKVNNLMYMIPTSDIRQLLELEPQKDGESNE